MKELLTEFLATILKEASREFKAVRKGKDGKERVVPFGSKESMNQAIAAPSKDGATYRPYNPAADGKLEKEPGDQPSTLLQPPPAKGYGRDFRGTTPPEQTTGVALPTGEPVDAEIASIALYGEDKKGKLRLDSPDAQSVLDKGFTQGEGAPPGTAGSNFNENISDEGSLVLGEYPDMDESTLTRVLFDRVRDTKLAEQQADPTVEGTVTYSPQGRSRISVPSDIKDPQDIIVYKNCVIAARSGRKKYIRALNGVKAAQEAVGFKKIKDRKLFGGAKGDLRRAQETVTAATKCFIYDEELGIVEVPKEVLIKWIQASGGGKNAADTVSMTVDVNGNLIYDGWSDKKTLKDIQGNSTLNEEYTAMSERVQTLVDTGTISSDDESTARGILLSAQEFSDELESKYADTSAQLAGYFLGEFDEGGNGEQVGLYMQVINHPDPVVRNKLKLVPKWQAFIKKVNGTVTSTGGRKETAQIRQFHTEAKSMKLDGDAAYWYVLNKMAEAKLLSADERKILERISETLTKAKTLADSGKKPSVAESKAYGPFVSSVKEKKNVEQLEIKTALKTLRRLTIEFQRDNVEQLNKITVTNQHGDEVKLGDHLEARGIIEMLHLDKIDLPEELTPENEQEYFEKVLVRSTQLVMEGIPVTPVTLRECLGVETLREFERTFELMVDDEDPKTIFVYTVRDGKRVRVARKQYRSKQGDTGKTGTTIVWEDDMKKCFDRKGAK